MLLTLPDDLLSTIVHQIKQSDKRSYANLCATCKRLSRPPSAIAELFWALPHSTDLLHPSQLYHLRPTDQACVDAGARVSGYVVRDERCCYRFYQGDWPGAGRLLLVGRQSAGGDSVVYSSASTGHRTEVARLRRRWFGKLGNRVGSISGKTHVQDIGVDHPIKRPCAMRCVVGGASYTTRAPTWNPIDRMWYQDFYGNVRLASRSNYQLVRSDADDSERRESDVRFTFGRLRHDVYFVQYDPSCFTATDAMIIAMFRV